MSVGIGTVAAQILSWEYLFRIFGICIAFKRVSLRRYQRQSWRARNTTRTTASEWNYITPSVQVAKFLVSDYWIQSTLAQGCRTVPPASAAWRTVGKHFARVTYISQPGTKNLDSGSPCQCLLVQGNSAYSLSYLSSTMYVLNYFVSQWIKK